MAKTKKRRKPAKRRGTAASQGGMGPMLVGLAAGLSIAGAIWYFTLPDTAAPVTKQAAPAQRKAPAETKPVAIEATGAGYDFYDMLPSQEVVVSDDFAARRAPAQKKAEAEPITDQGTYLIQAGSFQREEDAERMKATLALQGMRARIQKVQIKDQHFHRVRIGPLRNVDQVNDYRKRLRRADIDVMLIRVND